MADHRFEATGTSAMQHMTRICPCIPDLIILREVVCLLVGDDDAAHGFPRGADGHCAHAQHTAVRQGLQVLELAMVPTQDQELPSVLYSSSAQRLHLCFHV